MDILLETVSPFKPFIIKICSKEKKNREGKERTLDGKDRYMIYHSNTKDKTRAGTAIVVRKGTNVIFRTISDRICLMKIKASDNYTITVINAYAPTLPVSEKYPE